MSLRRLLKNFCIDAYRELTEMKELPRPPFNSPLIADNIYLTHPLSQLPSYKQLIDYMRESGLLKKLQDIGHTWIWHYEVFEWLFLERVIAENYEPIFNLRVFNKVYRYALNELARKSFRIRRITVLDGIPKLSTTLKLSDGLLLCPLINPDYDITRLLHANSHNKNRQPSLWINPESHLLVQDRLLIKGNRGSELHQLLERLEIESDITIKTLKLCVDTRFCPKAVYSSYISNFPLIPIIRTEFEEYSDIWFTEQRHITKKERLDINRTFKFIQGEKEPEYFETALSRFADSYRVKHVEQNVVDLIVALEAMLGVRVEELRRRLATNAAFLLGKNDLERQILFRQVSAGYKLRNSIVHGGRNQTREMSNALKEFFPELNNKTQTAVIPYITKAVKELQNVVRLVLKAYIYAKSRGTLSKWLEDEDDFLYLPFAAKKRSVIQKQLGLR